MSKGEWISRNELDRLPRSELCDEFVLDLTSRTFSISIYQVIYSGLYHTRGQARGNHAEFIYREFWIKGRVPNDIRRYAIDCLLGRKPITVDEDNKEARLLA